MVGTKRGRMVQFSSSYEPESLEKLEQLHAKTRIPIQEYMREALDDLLKKYAGELGIRGKRGKKD